MKNLKSSQMKYLRGLAHSLKPTVIVGQKGFTEALVKSTEEALDRHELIKVKFIDFKEKKVKNELVEAIANSTGSSKVGMIGHIALFYRQHVDPEKRKIVLPG